ncbi:MAG: hypothetical protein IT561_16310 [Alphaproteobacteria bacterium]|nr:hypothetical protein [Alphaproteobacteria bacterium]
MPLLVAALMALAAGLMSSGVLLRLTQEQEGRIDALSSAYLEATASALAPALARQDVWEAFDILDRSQRSFGALRLRLAAAISPDGRVLAATDARRLPVGAPAAPAVDREPRFIWASRDVVESGIGLGRVLIEIDVSEQQAQRFRLGLVLVAANLGLATFLAVLGWWLVRRMLRPVRLLTEHLGRGVAAVPAEVSQ